MNLQQWAQQWGVPIPHSPDLISIALAAVLAVGSYWIGWFLGGRLGPRIAIAVRRWTGHNDEFGAKLASAVCHYGIITLLLLIVGNAGHLTPLGLLIVAVALGSAVGMLALRVAGAIGVGSGIAILLGLLAFVVSTAGTLGGMQPLAQGMDHIGLTVGTHKITLLGIANFIVVAAVLYAVARIANRIAVHSIGRLNALDVSQRALIQKLASIVVVLVAALLGVDLLGIDLTALTVFSGAAGLAIGFGLQTTFGNLIAGIILLMDRSIKPGDVIAVNDGKGSSFGQVRKIGIRAVSVATRDNREYLIPNENLMTSQVENWSYSSREVSIQIPVGIAYGSDIDLAERLMLEAARGANRVLTDRPPGVLLSAFGPNSIDMVIVCWIGDPEEGVGNVRSEVLKRVWHLFRENGIEIPYPQQDVSLKDSEGLRRLADALAARHAGRDPR